MQEIDDKLKSFIAALNLDQTKRAQLENLIDQRMDVLMARAKREKQKSFEENVEFLVAKEVRRHFQKYIKKNAPNSPLQHIQALDPIPGTDRD